MNNPTLRDLSDWLRAHKLTLTVAYTSLHAYIAVLTGVNDCQVIGKGKTLFAAIRKATQAYSQPPQHSD